MNHEVLAIGLHGMQNDMARLEQIAMNLANTMTPGYKRTHAVTGQIGASFAMHLGAAAEAGDIPTGTAQLPVHIAVDARAGTLKSTGQTLDLALDCKGYFEVMTDAGPAYTRQGNFRIDGLGRLVTAQGYPVMGTAGEITVNTAKPVISANGEISNGTEGAAPIGQLKVVEFDASSPMARLGDGLLGPGSGMKALSEQDLRVRQGFIENSNVDPAQEMARLVQAVRHFETMQKVVQGYDDMLGNAIRKLGESS